MVVVTKEHLPKESLVHGKLPAFPTVASLGAGLRDELARTTIHSQLVILNAPNARENSRSHSIDELRSQLSPVGWEETLWGGW